LLKLINTTDNKTPAESTFDPKGKKSQLQMQPA